MKRFFIILILSLVTSLYAIDNIRYINSFNGLSLRENPDINSKIILTIRSNQKVEIIEVKNEIVKLEKKSGKWTKVKFNNNVGWIFGGSLEIISSRILKIYKFGRAVDLKIFNTNKRIETEEIDNPYVSGEKIQIKTIHSNKEWIKIHECPSCSPKQIIEGLYLSSNHHLPYGLKLGMSRNSLINTLGAPASNEEDSLAYFIETYASYDSIRFYFNKNYLIGIEWSYFID